MLKIIFVALLLIHGLIHLIGFVKAFDLIKVQQLTVNISKPVGVLWLIVSILFLFSGGLFFAKIGWWWVLAFVAIVFSQLVIISS